MMWLTLLEANEGSITLIFGLNPVGWSYGAVADIDLRGEDTCGARRGL